MGVCNRHAQDRGRSSNRCLRTASRAVRSSSPLWVDDARHRRISHRSHPNRMKGAHTPLARPTDAALCTEVRGIIPAAWNVRRSPRRTTFTANSAPSNVAAPPCRVRPRGVACAADHRARTAAWPSACHAPPRCPAAGGGCSPSARAPLARAVHQERAAAPMSHSDALSRLTVADRRSDMSRSARRNGIDTFEQDWHVPRTEPHPCWIHGRNAMKRLFALLLAALAAAALFGGLVHAVLVAANVVRASRHHGLRPDPPAALGHHGRWAGAARRGHRWAGAGPPRPSVRHHRRATRSDRGRGGGAASPSSTAGGCWPSPPVVPAPATASSVAPWPWWWG